MSQSWDAVTFGGPEDRYDLLGLVCKDIKSTRWWLGMCFVLVPTNITVSSKSSYFLMYLYEYSHLSMGLLMIKTKHAFNSL